MRSSYEAALDKQDKALVRVDAAEKLLRSDRRVTSIELQTRGPRPVLRQFDSIIEVEGPSVGFDANVTGPAPSSVVRPRLSIFAVLHQAVSIMIADASRLEG
eukprot:1569367-Rhodomonas_salina.4